MDSLVAEVMKIIRFSLKLIKSTLFPLFLFIVFSALPWSYSLAEKKATVLKIIDGDTIIVEYKGKKENVRLIGLDTPESHLNRKARKDAERNNADIRSIIRAGREATRFVQILLKPGDEVSLEFDTQIRDKYGRLLAYVFLRDGKMLNEEILRAGYAHLLTYPPNVKYVERFLRAYQEARENNRGLWRIASYKIPKN